ncbi:MAG: DNRLRE domain-containing protein [Fidelibacterota bacterium]
MKNIKLITTAAGLLWLMGCESSSVITADLTSPLTAYSTELRDISGETYQSPPEMGSYSKLYLGRENDFYNSRILLKMNRISGGLVTMESLFDSTVNIDSIYIVLQSPDTLVPTEALLDLYYFPTEGDSIFNENETNYLNVISPSGAPIASAGLYQAPPDSNEPVHPILKLSIPQDVLESIADTSESNTTKNRTFCIQPQDSLGELLTFYSRETGADPRLDVYYTVAVNDSTIDTLVQHYYPTQDLSIVVPPASQPSEFSALRVGRAAGFKSILKIDSIVQKIPETALIKKATLNLFVKDTIQSLSKLLIYPLDQDYTPIDSVVTEDNFQILTEYQIYATADSISRISINIKRLLQDYVLDNVANHGLKLLSNNVSPFTTREYFIRQGTETDPYLEVEYVAP